MIRPIKEIGDDPSLLKIDYSFIFEEDIKYWQHSKGYWRNKENGKKYIKKKDRK